MVHEVELAKHDDEEGAPFGTVQSIEIKANRDMCLDSRHVNGLSGQGNGGDDGGPLIFNFSILTQIPLLSSSSPNPQVSSSNPCSPTPTAMGLARAQERL